MSRHRISLLCVLFALAIALNAQGTAGTVRGRVQMVLANNTTSGWEFVRVSLEVASQSGTPLRTYTDSEGMYYFKAVPAGKYILSVATPDEQHQRYAVSVAAGDVFDVPQVSLKPASTYVRAFREGIRAADSKDWQTATNLMRYAIKLKGSSTEAPSKEVLINGVRIERYAPHFHLAEALIELGQCPEAIKALSDAESEVAGTPLKSQLQKLRGRCP